MRLLDARGHELAQGAVVGLDLGEPRAHDREDDDHADQGAVLQDRQIADAVLGSTEFSGPQVISELDISSATRMSWVAAPCRFRARTISRSEMMPQSLPPSPVTTTAPRP